MIQTPVSENCDSNDSFLVCDDQAKRTYGRWQPADGAIFADASHIAMDCETMAINSDQPELVPPLILAAASDGQSTRFLPPEDIQPFIECHEGCRLVFHNAAFDIPVLQKHLPFTDLATWVDEGRIFDTMLFHQLLVLAIQGHPAEGKGESTLENCAQLYLDRSLAKNSHDEHGHVIRTSFAQFRGVPFNQIPPEYLQYLKEDVEATALIFERQGEVFKKLCRRLEKSRPFGAPNRCGLNFSDWLKDQTARHGPLTHHIQLKASLALSRITANGLHIDLEKAEKITQKLQRRKDELQRKLLEHGLQPEGEGSASSLQAMIRRLTKDNPQLRVERTSTGLFETKTESLAAMVPYAPILQTLIEYRSVKQLLSTFAQKLNKPKLHPRFKTIVRTGRTSSFGDINAQNLPRDNDFRELIIPSPGHVFIKADYCMLEMCSLAEACISQFGFAQHNMLDLINNGCDLHREVAARIMGKPLEQVTAEDRRKVKAINFGKPGGLGNTTLCNYARSTFGVEMTEQEAARFSERWLELFPEMKEFLQNKVYGAISVARMLWLTPVVYAQATGDDFILGDPNHQKFPNSPSMMLGGMFLRTMESPNPCSQNFIAYPEKRKDYFWQVIQQFADKNSYRIPEKFREMIRKRQAQRDLRDFIVNLAERVSVITATGRIRANTTFCDSRNTIFQGLAADGAKEAIWKLDRAGYQIVNFIHDEVLVAIPEDSDLAAHVKTVEKLMIDGMKQVLPNVRVEVESKLLRSWSTKDEIQLPATPGSSPGSTPGSSDSRQEGSAGLESSGDFFPGSPIPKSGWGFGHPGRTDAASPNPFQDFLNDGGENDTNPVF